MIIDNQLLRDVWRLGRRVRILLFKFILDREIINVISACAPYVGSDETTKNQLWEDPDEMMQGIHIKEKLFIGGVLKGTQKLVIIGLIGYMEDLVLVKEMKHNLILHLALSYDLIFSEYLSQEESSHTITFISGSNETK